MVSYPKRLIEVDLPIREISAHARREKSIRHGHISTLHIWWARRPLAACRAILCAALWPDPLDVACPQSFRDVSALILCYFASEVKQDEKLASFCKNHWQRWVRTDPSMLQGDKASCWPDLRYGLLDFIADFSNWDVSNHPVFLNAARLLTHVAHLSLSDIWSFQKIDYSSSNLSEVVKALNDQIRDFPKPLVVDSFAGGGAIPFEALRVGADVFASDLNPVAVLLNKVILEFIPKFGNVEINSYNADGQPINFNGLAEGVQYWGQWVREQAEKNLSTYYPSSVHNEEEYSPKIEKLQKIDTQWWSLLSVEKETPIAYLWARTIICEGPGCGATVPLMRSLWLSKKGDRSVGLQIKPDFQSKTINFEIIERRDGKWVKQKDKSIEIIKPTFDGTVKRGSATCPICGYTTPSINVRDQLKKHHGGSNNARLFAVVCTVEVKRIEPTTKNEKIIREKARYFRLPTEVDVQGVIEAKRELERRVLHNSNHFLPNEATPIGGGSGAGRAFTLRNFGFDTFSDLFTSRQLLVLTDLVKYIKSIDGEEISGDFYKVVRTLLAMLLDKQADYLTSLCTWHYHNREKVNHTFARPTMSIVFDFVETVAYGSGAGSWESLLDWTVLAIQEQKSEGIHTGYSEQADATQHPLPTDSANLFFTDPPYYDAVPYSDLSEFFISWLKRSIGSTYQGLFDNTEQVHLNECIVDDTQGKDKLFFESTMQKAMKEGRRVLSPSGIGVIVFAHKSTAGWEAQLQAMINAGWIISGSWPIDTEMATRLRAVDSAALASSIHLVCRAREEENGEVITRIGDWREVLAALPSRIHDWLPRLANEGVIGADAIFACLGPALEVYSQYSKVEKASGETVSLKEYLEVVWAAVSHEALSLIFEGADATGFEEDSRLTAMWLWTLSAYRQKDEENLSQQEMFDSEDDEESIKSNGSIQSQYLLEYDTARKIAQGLGAHLERLTPLVEVKGDKARLLSVRERVPALMAQDNYSLYENKRSKSIQPSLFTLIINEDGTTGEEEWNEETVKAGETILDRLHQAMLLFSTNKSTLLKRFLVEDGIGKDSRFWQLAQALSALYPPNSEEKRWVDGVLARKKGMGF